MPHPSAYCRSGLDPMNAPHSIGMPTRCEISTIGLMSATSVRAAQLAAHLQLLIDDLPRQPLDVARRREDRRPEGRCRPCRCRARRSGGESCSFSSMVGQRTDGDCSPSRNVSSSSRTTGGFVAAVAFQSWIRGCMASVNVATVPKCQGARPGRRGRPHRRTMPETREADAAQSVESQTAFARRRPSRRRVRRRAAARLVHCRLKDRSRCSGRAADRRGRSRRQRPRRARTPTAIRARAAERSSCAVRSTIAVMSSFCAAPLANSRTSVNTASSSFCGSSDKLPLDDREDARPRRTPRRVADSASETPSLKTISQSPGASMTVSSS